MKIERTDKEIIIRIPANIDTDELQGLIDYLRYKELTSKIKVTQKEVDELAASVNKKWWNANKQKLAS